MIKLNWTAAFHIGLVGSITIHCRCPRARCWCKSATCVGLVASAPTGRHLGRVPLLGSGGAFKRAALGGRLNKQARAVLHRRAEGSLWALDAVLRSLLPLLASSLSEERLAATNRATVAVRLGSAAGNRLNCGTHGGCNSYRIGVVARAALNPVAGGQKGVESLDKIWVASKEFRNSIDHAGRINPTVVSTTSQ